MCRQVQVAENALLRDRTPADDAEPEAQHPVLREKFVEDLVQLASTAPVSTTTNVRDERHTYPRDPVPGRTVREQEANQGNQRVRAGPVQRCVLVAFAQKIIFWIIFGVSRCACRRDFVVLVLVVKCPSFVIGLRRLPFLPRIFDKATKRGPLLATTTSFARLCARPVKPDLIWA